MSYKITFSSPTRREVWRGYWRIWLSGFWSFHLLMAVAVGVATGRKFSINADVAPLIMTMMLAFVGSSVLFSAIAQLRFKPAKVTIRVDPNGLLAHIEDQWMRRTWSEISLVEESEGKVIFPIKNGHRLTILAKAFSSDSDWNDFLSDVRAWQTHAG